MFEASTTFLYIFQNRQGLSLRTLHNGRHSDHDETHIDHFLRKLNLLSNNYPPEFVFDMNKTRWWFCGAPRKVLAEKACDTVKFESTTGEKTSFTVLAAMSCVGQKSAFWVFVSERTVYCERKFGQHSREILRHSESGWTTENVIIAFIEWLHRETIDCKSCALVMYRDSSHGTEQDIAAAQENDIELVLSRPMEPTDSNRWSVIFGELKAKARSDFSR
jgi:hypothetical protein